MRKLTVRSLPILLALSLTATVAVVGPTDSAEARDKYPDAPKATKQKNAKVTDRKPVAAAAEVDPAKAAEDAAKIAREPVNWPAAGHQSVVLVAPAVKAKGLVTASSAKAGQGVTADLEFLDQAASARAGISGVLVKATTPKAVPDAQLTFDYSGYAKAFGADWDQRLQVVALPACMLTTPSVPGCTTSTPLRGRNDIASKTVTANAPLSTQQSVFAVTAGSESSTGSYAATSLSASSSWSGGGSSGDFTWSYPLRVPPAVAGPTPSLAFSYSAQSVDGRTSATNNQVSWVGEGFDLTDSFVERKYTSCDEDGNKGKYDQCWKYDNATLSLNGKSSELVRTSGGNTGAATWKLKNDDGSKVERLVTTVINGDSRKEYWKVTTTDGTQYYFGKHQLKAGMQKYTQSVFTVPVAGDDSGDPCYAATGFANSFCTTAWRWNLDYVVDLHGNAMSYWYTKEVNNYAKNGVASPGTPYVRGGYLNRIDYGLREDTLSDATVAPQQVAFTPAERCLADCSTLNSTTKANWPDVPFDQICEGTTPCTNKVSPTFFTRKRLYQIETKTMIGSAPQSVDLWQTNLTFESNGDTAAKPMWLNGISHVGKAGTALTMPDVTFKKVGLANRVDNTSDGQPGMVRYRIGEINTETGAKIMVNYAPKECMSGVRPDKDTNTKRCYPAKWTPPGEAEREDWFHKYVLDSVVTADEIGNGAMMTTQYVYSDGGAWHYQESPMLKDSDKTWSEWRGYGTVTTYTGDPAQPAKRSRTVTRYFRGMDGDKLEGTTARRHAEVADSEAVVKADLEPLAGSVREQVTYPNATSNTEISGAITDYFIDEKASQAVPGGVLKSNFVGASVTRSRVTRDGGRPDQVRKTATEYDPDNNLPVKVTDYGDDAKSGDETCTLTSYAKNPATGLIALPLRNVSSTGVCDATSASPPEDRVLSDVRSYYDGKPFGTTTLGDATSIERLHQYINGTPSYQPSGKKGYDALGRVTSSTDALDRVTTTAYTPALTGPLTQTVVKAPSVNKYDGAPVNFTTTTDYRPEWGLPSKTSDPNSKITEMAYDALGRLTAVWLPSQASASPKLANTKYTYTISKTSASSIRTDSLNIEANGYLTSYQLFDSLLRPRQTQSPGANTGRIISESRYDASGQVIYANSDIWNEGAPAGVLVDVPNASVPKQTFNEYDGAGRNVRSTFMSALQPMWSTSTLYGGDTTTVLPPAGSSAESTVTDAMGQVIERREYSGNTLTGTPDVTKYTYDLAGRMTRMDGAGGVWTNKYDLRGRKIESTDPDSGKSTSTYDEGDRLVSTTDSTNNTLVTTYDSLDRKTALYKTTATPANMLASWRYDKTGLLGQAAESASYTNGQGSQAYLTTIDSRNVLYQPTKVTKWIPADAGAELKGSYYTDYDYMPDQKTPKTISYPDGGGLGADSVSFSYTPLGLPLRMYNSAGTTFVNDVEYNQFGDQTVLDLGSKHDMPISNLYEEGTRRLSRSAAGKGEHVVSDHVYTYDPTGNVLKDHNLVDGGDAQCFDYDGHRRITEAWTPANADCTQAPSTPGLGGVAPYWQSWTYTPTGLRKTQVDHSSAGNTTSTFAYNADQPHTLAGVTQTGAGAAAPKSYSYDARGNTTVRPGQSLTWNALGKLTKLSGTDGGPEGDTEYVYDADGSLLVRRNPTETTLFLGELELTLNKATHKVQGKRQYAFAGQTIGVRSDNGTPTADFSWLVPDYHGTSQVAVDAATLTPTKRYAKPFGDPRGTAPTAWPDDHGFLNKPEDKVTGLTTVGAREYDPSIGRFISLDPVLDPNDPQQMLGYTYANDNPVSSSDPTGLRPADEDMSYTKNPDYDSSKYDDYVAASNNLNHSGGGNDDGGTNHAKKKKKWYQKAADFVDDKVDEAHDWAKEHASEIGTGIAIGAAIVGTAAFCGATAGIGCLIIAGAVAGAAGSGLGYGAEVALDDNKSFSTADLAQAMVIGGVSGAAGAGLGAGAGALGKALLAKTAPKLAKVLGTAATACSFAGTTMVLMADGSQKAIQDIRVGDEVVATDPETGEQAAKAVEHVFVHDDTVVDLKVDGEVLTTTENHPFWSVTDHRFERADELAPGELLLRPDGRPVQTSGLAWQTASRAKAFNLSIEGIHTYYVLAGDAPVLVHNMCKIVPGANGALRDAASGRFVANPAKKAVSALTSGHGNSRASTAVTHLYRLEDLDGNLLKWGITDNLKGRYTQGFLADKNLIPMTSGARDQMLNLERWIVERNAGPLNREPWAGK